MLNVLFYVIPAIISSIMLIIMVWGAGMEYYLMILIIGVSSALLSGNVGLIFNLLMPVMKWENVNRVVKQSGAVGLSVFCSMVVSAIVALLFFVWTYQNILVKYILVCAFLLVATIVTFVIIVLKGEKLLNKNIQL